MGENNSKRKKVRKEFEEKIGKKEKLKGVDRVIMVKDSVVNVYYQYKVILSHKLAFLGYYDTSFNIVPIVCLSTAISSL